jgi:hypothetical protein
MPFLLNSKMEITLQKRQEITSKVQRILRGNFSGPKAQEKPFRDRLNFACPYCGDSQDSHKKRGNLYWKNLVFHCYNCSKHTNLVEFFKDHGESITNKDDLILYLDFIRENQVSVSTKEYMELGIFESLRAFSIPLEVVKDKLGLVEPKENLRIEKYLKGRFMHNKLNFFMYDPTEEQVYIFNLTSDMKNTVGWQIRNFKPGREKYISYNIEKINQMVLNRTIELPDEDIVRMNTLSIYFNIALVDFTQPVTIFEGPIDSLICKNSIAISGVDKPTEMFDDIPTVRYLFDNDYPGRKQMEYQLKRRKTVFMWNKLVRDFKVQPRLANMKSVKDFNDLLKYCWNTKNDAIKNFDKYFTNNPLDIRSV